MTNPIDLRKLTPSDQNFVAASWFECYWKLHARNTPIHYDTYKVGQDKVINRVINGGQIIVAYARNVPDEIAGYVAFDKDVLHFLYVKKAYRHLGIGSGLISPNFKRYSHDTGKRWQEFAKKKGLIYDPYALP